MSAAPQDNLEVWKIRRLPPWAMVAFAARCAMRVQPLVGVHSFGDRPQVEISRYIRAIDIAVTIATVGRATTDEAAEAAANAAAAAEAADADAAAANAAAAAANAATAAEAAEAADADAAAAEAADAAANAAAAARTAGTAARANAARANAAAQSDLEHLLSSPREMWNEDLMNRPLWPTGEPEGWRRHVDAWGEELHALAGEYPFLNGVYERHVRLLEGDGFDVEQAKERIARGIAFVAEEASDQAAKEAELATPDESADEPAMVDRRGAATSTLDAPTADDHLERKPLVGSLAAMFAAPEQATPFTLALLGDWGAGKSSVMEQLAKELSSEKHGGGAFQFLFATFNAWQYEHTDDIRAGLAQEVIKGLTDDLSALKRLGLKIRFACAEQPWEFLRTVFGLVAAILAASSVFWLQSWDQLLTTNWIKQLVGSGLFVGAAAFAVYLWKSYKPIFDHPLATKLQTYLKLPDYGTHLGVVPLMTKHIKTICQLRGVKAQNARRRLVVFVDDLDRCDQDCITQTFDAIRLVMDIPNVIVVIAIDYRIAFAAVAKHYANLANGDRSPQEIARDYLGKIIQLPVELPPPKGMRPFIRERLFSTVDMDELESLARRRDLQSSSEMLEEMVGDDELEAASQPSIEEMPTDDQAATPTIEKAEDEVRIPELMQETAMDCRLFEKWTGAFKFANPRQLIRLRNTYRLLTQLDHVRGVESTDDLRMAMLFWLEFLYQKPIEEQKQYEDVLVPPEDIVIDGTARPGQDRIAREITEFGIHGVLRDRFGETPAAQRFEYEKLKQRVGRFVLQFGGEPAPTSD